jgi:protein ImuB
MLWAALQISPSDPSCCIDAPGLASWCLQFSPRVAVHDASTVVVELSACERLFGGRQAIVERVQDEAGQLGVTRIAWSLTSLASVALVRCAKSHDLVQPLTEVLDALPLMALPAVLKEEATLARLGCRVLADVRALPRGGLSRRFDKSVLAALDQAYGLRPEVHTWVVAPDTFAQRLELPSRVETAPALLFGAHRLLLQLCAWLSVRHAGVTAIELAWRHDTMRARAAGEGGALTVRTSIPTRQMEHLSRLLAEHLAKVELAAPVDELTLTAVDTQLLEAASTSFLPEPVNEGESLTLVLERLAARLGPENVRRPVAMEDHRLEWMCQWEPAPTASKTKTPTRLNALPQPTFVFDEPIRLALRDNRPYYQGPLHLRTGPHRVESGWWHRVKAADGAASHRHVTRDYWVAESAHAGVLWVYQTRLSDSAEMAWYLHGNFA